MTDTSGLSLDIITVTKDDAEGVAQTIRSTAVLRTIPGVRQVVVDGSGAEEAVLVRELAAGQPNVEYRWRKPAGISNAFNEGIAGSRAEWLWFLNGRDVVHPNFDVDLLLKLLGSTKADALIGQIDYMQSRRTVRHPPLWKQWPPLYWLPHPATIMKRDLFVRFGMFSDDFRIGMDGELWLRVFSKQVVVDMLSVPFAVYDEEGLSSRTARRETVREVDRMVVRHLPALFRIWLGQGFYLFRALRGRLLGRW